MAGAAVYRIGDQREYIQDSDEEGRFLGKIFPAVKAGSLALPTIALPRRAQRAAPVRASDDDDDERGIYVMGPC